MSENRIAKRYSKSLFDLCQSKGVTDAVYNDLMEFVAVLKENRQLTSTLKSPIVKQEQKSNILANLFGNFNPETTSFLTFVTAKKREANLLAIASDFINLYNDGKGIAFATVTSAIPLSSEALDKIKSMLGDKMENKSIELENIIDPTVIGGMVIRFGDNLLDMSISKELKDLRQELIYN
jgi:F-type H+-transporting ATPase subunit delta